MSTEPETDQDEEYDLTEEEEAELFRRYEASLDEKNLVPWEAVFPPKQLTG